MLIEFYHDSTDLIDIFHRFNDADMFLSRFGRNIYPFSIKYNIMKYKIMITHEQTLIFILKCETDRLTCRAQHYHHHHHQDDNTQQQAAHGFTL